MLYSRKKDKDDVLHKLHHIYAIVLNRLNFVRNS